MESIKWAWREEWKEDAECVDELYRKVKQAMHIINKGDNWQ